jgi:hypothetical protein
MPLGRPRYGRHDFTPPGPTRLSLRWHAEPGILLMVDQWAERPGMCVLQESVRGHGRMAPELSGSRLFGLFFLAPVVLFACSRSSQVELSRRGGSGPNVKAARKESSSYGCRMDQSLIFTRALIINMQILTTRSRMCGMHAE